MTSPGFFDDSYYQYHTSWSGDAVNGTPRCLQTQSLCGVFGRGQHVLYRWRFERRDLRPGESYLCTRANSVLKFPRRLRGHPRQPTTRQPTRYPRHRETHLARPKRRHTRQPYIPVPAIRCLTQATRPPQPRQLERRVPSARVKLNLNPPAGSSTTPSVQGAPAAASTTSEPTPATS